MKGDFSRETFDPKKKFSRVLMQQGRVQLDADWNEQAAILLHYLRTLARDFIGKYGGPDDSFLIKPSNDPKIGFDITPGHYYVDGILCANEMMFDSSGQPVPPNYFDQPNYQRDSSRAENKLPAFPFLAYLDVWERHITCFEDESLCEVALGAVDTTTRTQVIWQVKAIKPDKDVKTPKNAETFSDGLPTISNALLRARAQQNGASDDPCLVDPDAKYRGAENQLYRVEIHTGNMDQTGKVDNQAKPTFKWSRENGSVVFPVVNITRNNDKTRVELANMGRDDRFALREGDLVEIVDDMYALENRTEKLLQVSVVDRDELTVTLNGTTNISVHQKPSNHPLLRRWDHRARKGDGVTLAGDNAIPIVEDTGKDDNWLTLEDGVQIQFQKIIDPATSKSLSTYRTGDYWLIPARVATGDVEWPKDAQGKNPLPQPPRGVEHHYAPLAIVTSATNITDARSLIK